MSRVGRFHVACVCALTQWVLAFAIQIGNLFGYQLPPGQNHAVVLALFAALPLIQTQNALVAVICGIVAYFAARHRITAWIFFAICCLESVYLLIDQVYYKVFLDHIRLGAFEGGQQINFTLLLGSFFSELDWIFCCTALIAVLCAAGLAWALVRQPVRPTSIRYALGIAVALAVAGIPSYSARQYEHVNQHAVVIMTRELSKQSLAGVLAGRASPGHRIAAYRSPEPPDVDPRLAAIARAAAPRYPQPNVLLIVLESVGSLNLLDAGGLPVPAVAPNLAALARNGIVFNSLYTSFPGTTRSLVTLHTGGRQPTYGGVADFYPRFQGPALTHSIEALGYRTAYFSSERMDGEGSDIFLKQMEFGKYYDFSQDVHAREAGYQIHSWGAREDYTVGLIENWIAGAQHEGQPFLLEYMTTATHHPYGAPPGYPAPFPPHDRNSDYLNALNYTDHAIGAIVDFLRRNGLLDNTIVAVTGDHGESFGERHANNFLHKNFTYDENIREFLLIRDGRLVNRNLIPGPVISSRVGSTGDILPTLLALLGSPPVPVPGRSLLAENFESRPVFFHKLSTPETWGLRDGRWKYIGEIRTNAAELYDLSSDPAEQRNLASAEPRKVALYREMAQEWYLDSEREFTALLKGHRSTDSRLTAGDTRMGARMLSVGAWDPSLSCSGSKERGYNCHDGSFVEKSVIGPGERPLVRTKWALDPDYQARYEWISPSGKRIVNKPADTGEWHVTGAPFPGTVPMERGVWLVHLREKDQAWLSAQFTVK